MKIYLVRHGQTASNVKQAYMGQKIDESLNETGRKEAIKLISELPKNLDLILSSPLKRASETAEIISQEFNVPIQYRKELVERDGGKISGMLWSDIEKEFGLSLDHFQSMLDYDFTVFGGESIGQVRTRIERFFEELEKYKGKKILVVTHGGIIKVMHAIKPQASGRYTPVTNAKVIEFEI